MSIKRLPWLDPVVSRFQDGLPQAVLIRGQPGVGKLQLAMHLARRQLCETRDRSLAPCGSCPACHLSESGNHPDLRVVEPRPSEQAGEEGQAKGKKGGEQIPVDAIRGLSELMAVSAHRSRARVVVIRPAETMHPSAANALLKMLEEPPVAAYFILVSSQPHRLPRTILSRCFQVEVAVPEQDAAAQWLGDTTGKRAALALAMGAYAPLGAKALSEDTGFWDGRQAVLDALAETDPDPVRVAESAEQLEPRILARLLWMWSFDLVLAGAGLQPRYHADYATCLERQARRVSPVQLFLWQDRVLQYARAAYHPLNRRLALEALFCAYPSDAA